MPGGAHAGVSSAIPLSYLLATTSRNRPLQQVSFLDEQTSIPEHSFMRMYVHVP